MPFSFVTVVPKYFSFTMFPKDVYCDSLVPFGDETSIQEALSFLFVLL